MKRIILLIVALVLLPIAIATSVEEYSYVTGSVRVQEASPTTSQYTNDNLAIKSAAGSDDRWDYFYINVSNASLSGTTVVSAHLSLYYNANTNADAGYDLNAYYGNVTTGALEMDGSDTNWNNQPCTAAATPAGTCHATAVESHDMTYYSGGGVGRYTFDLTEELQEEIDFGDGAFTVLTKIVPANSATERELYFYLIYKFGEYRPFFNFTVSAEAEQAPTITLLYPTNKAHLDNNTYPIKVNGTVTVTGGSVSNTWINDTRFKQGGTSAAFNFTANGSFTSGENVHLRIFANNSQGTTRNASVNFTVDFTSPTATSNLNGNGSYFYKFSNITFQINFTDNVQMYSFNVTTPEGYLYNITGLPLSKYQFDGGFNLSNYSVGKHNITANFCDAHTSLAINPYEESIDKNLKQVRYDFGNDYVSIRPSDSNLISDVTTEKLKDRYTFEFTKNPLQKSSNQAFIVTSSKKIDILGDKKGYYAWLVIPGLGKWIDFNTNNKENLKYTTTRINDNTILVEIEGIKDDVFRFNSIGNLNCNSRVWEYYVYNTTLDYTTNVVEGLNYTYTLTVNFDGIVLNGSAEIYYNDTKYLAAKTTTATSLIFEKNITTPRGNVTPSYPSFYWNYTINGTSYVTSNYTQTAQRTTLYLCGNLSNTSVLNVTFYDEANNSKINIDIEAAFTYGQDVLSPTLTNVNNMSICIYPGSASKSGSYYIYYSDALYPQRRYYETSAVYDNITQYLSLYLLSVNDGIYTRFRVVDAYNNPLSGVDITSATTVGGSSVVVEREQTDDSGLATFWTNPDADYVFTFTKTGYLTYAYTLRPTTTEIITVALESEETQVIYSYSTGIDFDFKPKYATLNNGTSYSFQFNLTSTYWNLTGCYFRLTNGSETLSSIAGTYADSYCRGTINYNVGNQSTIIANGIYTIEGLNFTETKQYAVYYTYQTNFSLKHFIDDLTNFSGAGFNNTSRMIVTFIVIFIIIGLVSYKYAAFREPEPLLILLWILIVFFSYVQWLTVSLNTIPVIRGLPTTWLNQYIIAILFTLIAGAYMLRRIL